MSGHISAPSVANGLFCTIVFGAMLPDSVAMERS